jgi:hypothetical protein
MRIHASPLDLPQFLPFLQNKICGQCCGYEMFIPDRIQGTKRFPDSESGSGSASKNLSILTQKIVSKLSEI